MPHIFMPHIVVWLTETKISRAMHHIAFLLFNSTHYNDHISRKQVTDWKTNNTRVLMYEVFIYYKQ